MSAAGNGGEDSRRVAAEASDWVARRDRGLTAAEQDEFLQWLHRDTSHRQALVRGDRTWQALDALVEWHPSHSVYPNPDLLAPVAPRRRWRVGLVACAALVMLTIFFSWQPSRDISLQVEGESQGVRVIPRPEAHLLPDGSSLMLNTGARFALQFTPGERRLRLLEGELHVTVVKNPERPFVVEVGNVAVRAVGTAFNVRRTTGDLEVLVTEGRVQIEQAGAPREATEAVPVALGEKARVDLGSSRLAEPVAPMSADQMSRELAWQSVRLQFDGIPLAAVAEEFNLRSATKIKIGDLETGRLRVSGTFQADQVEAFARLFALSYSLDTEVTADGVIVIKKTPLKE